MNQPEQITETAAQKKFVGFVGLLRVWCFVLTENVTLLLVSFFIMEEHVQQRLAGVLYFIDQLIVGLALRVICWQ